MHPRPPLCAALPLPGMSVLDEALSLLSYDSAQVRLIAALPLAAAVGLPDSLHWLLRHCANRQHWAAIRILLITVHA